ncbi:MAG: NUDIX hydrolase [Acidobacteria bacterium]|nr:NUDIX hydrolase [Acidobacteriota bacterium]
MTTHRDRDRFAKWARDAAARGDTPAIPAATLVLVSERQGQLETLMLRKNSKITFGGMWVFPGGRLDLEDYHDDDGDLERAARVAAVRETREETDIGVDAAQLEWFAHWTPPPVAPKRFTTFFFAAETTTDVVEIDGGEIYDAEWMAPLDALERRDRAEIELAPPTWVTLHHLSQHDTVSSFLEWAHHIEPAFYETHIGLDSDGPVAMWHGDAGYDTNDPHMPGPRHRLRMYGDRYHFEQSESG